MSEEEKMTINGYCHCYRLMAWFFGVMFLLHSIVWLVDRSGGTVVALSFVFCFLLVGMRSRYLRRLDEVGSSD